MGKSMISWGYTNCDGLEALRDGERTLVRMPMRAMDAREGRNRRLHIGILSLCVRGEAALRKVADAAGIRFPTDRALY